jgi:hypothetical protein
MAGKKIIFNYDNSNISIEAFTGTFLPLSGL